VSESDPIKIRRSDQPQPALGESDPPATPKARHHPGRPRPRGRHHDGTLSLIERGHANPTWGTVKGIAAALGVSMGELGKLADKLSD
jgi:hypothetical protein